MTRRRRGEPDRGHRYRALVSYIGTRFHGWQAQKNAATTVQAALEEALEGFAGEPVTAVAAGRTDAGVHADGQVVHFDLSDPLEGFRVRDAVNARLPEDVRLLEVAPVPSLFDARRDAAWKEYLYRWSRAGVIPPRDRLFVAPLSPGADPGRMREAARLLEGERDFGIFAVQGPVEGSSVRTLSRVAIEEAGEEIHALFRGDGFLRGMVRSICGVLADVARGKAPASRMKELLETGNRRLLSPKAPARGLTLVRVHYEPGEPGRPRELTAKSLPVTLLP